MLLTRYQFLFKNMLKTWRSVSQDQEEGSAQIRHRKQKSALKQHACPPARPCCPSGQRVGTSPRPGPRGARSAWRGKDTAWTWPRGGGAGGWENRNARGRPWRGGGTSGTRLPLRPGWVAAVSTSTSGGQGPEGRDILSIHLDHSLATKARTDGHLVQVKPEHQHEGLGWVSNLSRVRGHDAGPRWRGEGRGPPAGEQGSAPAGVPKGRAQPCWLTSLARRLQREAEWRQALP